MQYGIPMRNFVYIIAFSIGLTSFAFSMEHSKSKVDLTTRSDILFFQDEMDMNLTKRFHIESFQDLSDYNITQRHHIELFQDLSDYNITKRHHINAFQSYVAENSKKCDFEIFGICLIYS